MHNDMLSTFQITRQTICKVLGFDGTEKANNVISRISPSHDIGYSFNKQS